jgi:undecaprenyl-diphosphatase
MLEELDQRLFLLINSRNSGFWDFVMFSISRIVVWIPLYLAILIALGRLYRKKLLVILLFIIIAITLSDQISVFLKNSFERPRPCHAVELEDIVHLVKGHCGGKFGFVSSHAANSFNIALLSLLLIRRRWFSVTIIIWAAVVGYSRIYLGVHYPGDILCGSLLGALIGWGIYNLYKLTDRKLLEKRNELSGS